MKRADWDELDVRDVEAGGEVLVGRDDFIEAFLAVVHEVHLVHAHHHVAKAEEGSDEAVAVGLFKKAVPGIDEDDGEVCR